jgi:acyl-CoA thioester hydrolase
VTKTNEKWPDLAGRLVGGGHVLPVRINFEDTDFSGVVYHANYLKFMERARSDMLRLMGSSHDALVDGVLGEPLAFAVHRIEVDFRGPARIDELIEVETRVGDIGGARLRLDQTVRRGEETLVQAKVTIVMINKDGRARRIPDAVREGLTMLDRK